MKRRRPPHPNPTKKRAEQSVKQPGCAKVWVNPKSHLKITCERAWSEAGVPSPKFIDMSQIDMRTKKILARPKAKAAAATAKVLIAPNHREPMLAAKEPEWELEQEREG